MVMTLSKVLKVECTVDGKRYANDYILDGSFEPWIIVDAFKHELMRWTGKDVDEGSLRSEEVDV